MSQFLNSSDILLLKQAFIDFIQKALPFVSDTQFKAKSLELRKLLGNDSTKAVDIIDFVHGISTLKSPQQQKLFKDSPTLFDIREKAATQITQVKETQIHTRNNSANNLKAPESENSSPLKNHYMRGQRTQTQMFDKGSKIQEFASRTTYTKATPILDSLKPKVKKNFLLIQSTILQELKDASSNFMKNTFTLDCVYSKSHVIISPRQVSEPKQKENTSSKLPEERYQKKNFDEYAKLAEQELNNRPGTLRKMSIYARKDQDFKTKTRQIEQQLQAKSPKQRKIFI